MNTEEKIAYVRGKTGVSRDIALNMIPYLSDSYFIENKTASNNAPILNEDETIKDIMKRYDLDKPQATNLYINLYRNPDNPYKPRTSKQPNGDQPVDPPSDLKFVSGLKEAKCWRVIKEVLEDERRWENERRRDEIRGRSMVRKRYEPTNLDRLLLGTIDNQTYQLLEFEKRKREFEER